MTIGSWEFAKAMQSAGEQGFDGLSLAGLDGRGIYGPKQGAVVLVGLGVDHLLTLVGRTFGDQPDPLGWQLTELERQEHRITARHAERYALGMRIEQIGNREAGATFARVKGRYRGKDEPTVQMAFIFTYPKREADFSVFQENILKLAEDMAYAFAQREIIIDFQSADEAGHEQVVTHTVSPFGFPAPTEPGKALKKFIDAAKRNAKEGG